ncbi:MAG TPA: hypothetical protein VEB86_07145, partial [Chryseosolibacter sp.]|nr:hypothetical protein [Chryseosolibacter sp.]
MSIKPARFKELLTRYLDGKASPEEQKLLDGFFSSYEKEVLENPSSFHDHKTRDEILENILE